MRPAGICFTVPLVLMGVPAASGAPPPKPPCTDPHAALPAPAGAPGVADPRSFQPLCFDRDTMRKLLATPRASAGDRRPDPASSHDPGARPHRARNAPADAGDRLARTPPRDPDTTLPAMTDAPPPAERTTESLPLDLDLTLADGIRLAIRNNRSLMNARLRRVAQKLALRVAEDEFRPDATIGVFGRIDSTEGGDGWEGLRGASPEVGLRIPTGGRFNVTWDDTTLSTLSFTQPLLKGGGIAANTASLASARRAEQSNVLALESAVASVVTSVIQAYRRLIQAERKLEIGTRSLQRAQDLVTVNRHLIRSGRMAERDIVQAEAEVANRELGLTRTQIALDSARLALIDVLDIDSRTRIRPVEALAVEPVALEVASAVASALRHRPDYGQALLGIEDAESNRMLARNNRLWDLSASFSVNFDERGDSRTGRLNLTIPFGDPSREARYVNADIALRQARNNLAELRQSIDIAVRNAVRNAGVQFRQVELARRARELSEQKLAVEKEKLARGLTTNFRVVTFEDNLVQAQNSEVDTIIAYLNALTVLDQTLGTTLRTWQIDIRQVEE